MPPVTTDSGCGGALLPAQSAADPTASAPVGGAMHEEYWETRSDCTTKIELFQLWINLPARQKADPAAIRYVGEAWGAPYEEKVQVRALGPCPLAVGWPALTRLRVARVSGGACGLLGALPRPSAPFRALPRPSAPAWWVRLRRRSLLCVLCRAAQLDGRGKATRVRYVLDDRLLARAEQEGYRRGVSLGQTVWDCAR